ncbi:MAG: hypothetical protein CL424_10675 [Acidimicrobiaceae bacterium]|nr:hypothetical protein [Acidimicrobiaceae bacterium]
MTTASNGRVPAAGRLTGELPAIPGVDESLDPRMADPGLYRAGRLRAWWSKALDPVELSSSRSQWTWRPAVALAIWYIAAGSLWIVLSSLLVADSDSATPEIVKGLGFVVVTGGLLGALLLQYGERARRSADRLRQLIESAGDLTFRYRIWPTVGFEYISSDVEQWMGLRADDYYEQPDIFVRHVHPDDRLRFSQMLASADSREPVLIRWVGPDGRVFHSMIDVRAVVDRQGRVVAIDGRIRDVTDLRLDRAESAVEAAALDRLVRGEDVTRAIEEACGDLVELMGVEIAAVGLPSPDGSIDLFCAAGDTQVLDGIRLRWDEGPLAEGPTGRCVREREPVVMSTTAPGFSAWRHLVRDSGATACLAIPIIRHDRVIATLTLWSRFGNPFDPRNVDRFDRIARRLGLVLAELVDHRTSNGDGATGRARAAAPAAPSLDVRGALDDGRIEPWWQPQVDAEGRIVALEMLIRLRGDDGEIVAPNVVIPAAEALGLMPAVGRATRSLAVEQAVPWLEAGLDRICVNASVGELMSPGFVDHLKDLVNRHDVRPAQIEIELVETAPLEAAAQRVLYRLVDQGFRLAVDDYGSGWASLSHLSRLPARVIKVDRVFIRDVVDSARAHALVKSTIDLGRTLDLVTVAEGVETAAQAALLIELGCDLMQGFLFSPPAAGSHIDAMLRSDDRPFWPIIASSVRPTATARPG